MHQCGSLRTRLCIGESPGLVVSLICPCSSPSETPIRHPTNAKHQLPMSRRFLCTHVKSEASSKSSEAAASSGAAATALAAQASACNEVWIMVY